MLLMLYFCLVQPSQISNPHNISDDNFVVDDTFLMITNASAVHYVIPESKRCMDELGCFKLSADFYSWNRPYNYLPQGRKIIDTKFELFTKLQPREPKYLKTNNHEDLKRSSINPNHKTIFIVHGFFDNKVYGKWMEELKTELLIHGDYNVIIVDWSKGNRPPYIQATANTRVVGAEIALFIQTLENVLGISPMDCHIIGHSLGAHIAGYAGERLNKLGRITALDPARPYFEYMPPSVRIDPTDAAFVDAIHTDTFSVKFLAFGLSHTVGHMDFYPNDGYNQPGCSTAKRIFSLLFDGLSKSIREFASCCHQRSIDYFIHSLNLKKTLPIAHPCGSWRDFKNGKCSDCGKNNEKCAVMGMKAIEYKHYKNSSKPIKLYLSTTANAPYWEYSYQVTVKFSNATSAYNNEDIYIASKEPNNKFDFKLLSKTGYRASNGTCSYFVNSKKELSRTKNLTFRWMGKSSKSSIYLEYVKVTPTNAIDKTTTDEMTKTFCYPPTTAVKSKEVVSLVECD